MVGTHSHIGKAAIQELNNTQTKYRERLWSSTSGYTTPQAIIDHGPKTKWEHDEDLTPNHSNWLPQTIGSLIFLGLASTVSFLSRARLFRFDANDPYCLQTLGDGCISATLSGDVPCKVFVSQGTKSVGGGVYRIVSRQDSTIGAFRLDEMATEQLDADGDDDDVDEEEPTEEDMNAKQLAAAAYAKAGE